MKFSAAAILSFTCLAAATVDINFFSDDACKNPVKESPKHLGVKEGNKVDLSNHKIKSWNIVATPAGEVLVALKAADGNKDHCSKEIGPLRVPNRSPCFAFSDGVTNLGPYHDIKCVKAAASDWKARRSQVLMA